MTMPSNLTELNKISSLGVEILADVALCAAQPVNELQMDGYAMDDKIRFTSLDFVSGDLDSSTDLADGLTSSSVELQAECVGFKVPVTQLDGALKLGGGGIKALKPVSKRVARAQAKRMSKKIVAADMLRGVGIIFEDTAANVADTWDNAAIAVRSEFGEKVYGIGASKIKGKLVKTFKDTGYTTDSKKGRIFNIGDTDEYRCNDLGWEKCGTGASFASSVTSSTAIGSTVVLTGATAGDWYVFKSSNKHALVVATSATAGKLVYADGAVDGTSTSIACATNYVLGIIRSENSQAYGDCSKLLPHNEGAFEQQGAFKVLAHVYDKGSQKVDYEFTTGYVCGCIDPKAQKYVIAAL